MGQKYFVRRNGEAVHYGNKQECEKYVADRLAWWGDSAGKPTYTIEEAEPQPRLAWDEGGYYCDYSY